MTPWYSDDWLTVYHGDSRAVLSELAADSVNCVVTSPPYYGLRDYGEPGQLGLEPTPEEYVANLVAVFREVRRVLRPDGTVWLNLGDSYAAQRGGTAMPAETLAGGVSGQGDEAAHRGRGLGTLGGRQDNSSPPFRTGPVAHRNASAFGLKHKDLVGIPWRVAFALQADGWYLRSDIIWAKPNPMPESVTDRPTKSHEYLFLLTKSARYWYDADAIATDAIDGGKVRTGPIYGAPASAFGIAKKTGNMADDAVWTTPTRSNRRSVWTVATQPYPGAHFAVFPEALVEPCILAGCPIEVCVECGAPWERIVERGAPYPRSATAHRGESVQSVGAGRNDHDKNFSGQEMNAWRVEHPDMTTGWRPTCRHVQCADCGNISVDGKNTDGDGLRGVRHDVHADEPTPGLPLLLEDVRESSHGQDESDHQGLRDLPEGLHPPVPSDASDGYEDGLFGRASAGDGRDAGTDADLGRSGRPHQPRSGRQPTREPARDDEEGARRYVEPGPREDGDLPELRASLPVARQCGLCGGDLGPVATVAGTVLDMFAGSGTTGLVAQRLSRRAVLIDLSMEYLGQLMDRNRDIPLGLGA